MDLTKRQQQILQFIHERLETTGAPPTRAEIAQAFKFRSPNAAQAHLQALAQKGVLALVPGTSRGIQLKGRGLPGRLPLVGRVAAGQPILAEQNIEAHYQLDAGLFRPRADYLLKVHGLSMRDAGILDGDLLAVHRTPKADNGQIVVARVEDEVTVKRFQRRQNKVRLLPENAEFSPIEVDLQRQTFAIEGIAVGIIRTGKLV